jgi:hypothetical protein
MRNLLALAAAGILGFAGIGWYLGWYSIQSEPTPTGRHISIDLNTPKIKEDVGRGKEKLRDYLTPDDKIISNTPPAPNGSPVPPQAPVTPAGFQRTEDGGLVYPATNQPMPPFAPVPPSGSSPRLPMPR